MGNDNKRAFILGYQTRDAFTQQQLNMARYYHKLAMQAKNSGWTRLYHVYMHRCDIELVEAEMVGNP